MKILRPSIGAAGIFFPIGSPQKGGTCQHASDICLKKCYALADKNYDESVNISEKDKKEIYRFFVKKTTFAVCSEIIKEMDGLQTKILSWFTSGDCLDKDIDKLYGIMVLLHEEDIVQNGFTRNWKLYRRILEGGKIHHLALTLESLSHKDNPLGDRPLGLWAVPDYKTGIVKLYHGKLGNKSYGGCGFNDVVTKFDGKEVKIATNCIGCYHKKIGCFYIGK